MRREPLFDARSDLLVVHGVGGNAFFFHELFDLEAHPQSANAIGIQYSSCSHLQWTAYNIKGPLCTLADKRPGNDRNSGGGRDVAILTVNEERRHNSRL